MKSTLICMVLFVFIFCYESNGQATNVNSESNRSSKMKEFSLLVRVPTTYTPEQAKAVNPKWDTLINKWKTDSTYIISFAFPSEGYVVNGSEKVIKKGSVISDNLRVVSNLFIRTANIEAAIELSKSIPILEFDGTIEIREIFQRPTTPKK